MEQASSNHTLQAEIDALKASLQQTNSQLEEAQYRLEEANDMIEAIRSGEVDALVVKGEDGHQLYTLKSSNLAYRIFVEQMTTGAATLNRQGTILYCNSRFASILELPLEKVAGSVFCDLAVASEISNCNELMNAAWVHSGLKRELNLITSSGKEVPVLLSLQAMQLEEGLFMSVIVTDLTDQKKQQQLLKEKNIALQEAQETARELNANLEQTVRERTKELYSNQERLSRILETMAEGVEIIDTNGHLTYANLMAQKILGITQSETDDHVYIDPKWQAFHVNGSPLPENEHPMAIAMTSGKSVYDFEIGMQAPDRERFYISINAAPIRDEQGTIIGSIGTFTDVTHRRKSIQQKDDFISVASHELRTPIATLKASLQLLGRMKENPDPVMLHRLIDQSNKSLNKVSVLVNDLLDTKKMSEGQLQLNKTCFSVAVLVNDCCQHIRATGNYEITYEGDKDIMVEADMDKIDQVLVNLVNNAVKYAAASKQIKVRVVREGKFAKINVVDGGPGIPQDRLSNLFERYYRVDTKDNHYSGLGLGLYISAEIIQKHGGKIGVESKLGEGSTFWFTIPLA
ncbi:MAG: PAS domain-containing sensor histidine kinase [Chitinophagaceae bacterium]|nr:MAG: PAS domain-containing sensor histidine kinase [Chitinophagaceae bacterium]